MDKTLHILNGDSTAAIFADSGLSGKTLVWREMLCEGSLHKNVGSDAFWIKRYGFFEEAMGVDRLSYFDRSIREILKIEDNDEYNEAVLWFEYDLFCQVNLLAACSFLLKNYRKDIRYHLVCTGKEKGKKELQSLSDYPAESYKDLYKNRIKLTRNDLLFAQQCWELYADNDQKVLREFDFDQNKKFRYLQAAIDQHLMRFPDKNGLDQIDRKIIELSKEGTDEGNLVKELLNWQRKESVYGFGDPQYENKIKKLKEKGIL